MISPQNREEFLLFRELSETGAMKTELGKPNKKIAPEECLEDI